jgi:hypothetical protein
MALGAVMSIQAAVQVRRRVTRPLTHNPGRTIGSATAAIPGGFAELAFPYVAMESIRLLASYVVVVFLDKGNSEDTDRAQEDSQGDAQPIFSLVALYILL